jgi:hypothetical protein
MADIPALERAVASAEDELFRVQMADSFAFTNGAYSRALNVLTECRRELRKAQLLEIERLGVGICATGAAIVRDLTAAAFAAGIATADTGSQEPGR